MRVTYLALTAAITLVGSASVTPADTMVEHTAVAPQEIAWGPAPAALPPGAEAAVLFGDPSKDGLFVLRLKLPESYRIPPHTHPVDEVVTVISGTFSLGMGESADRNTARPLPAGSFVALPPDMPHFVFIEEETVVQISTIGPWGLTYVNPEDDPRPKVQ